MHQNCAGGACVGGVVELAAQEINKQTDEEGRILTQRDSWNSKWGFIISCNSSSSMSFPLTKSSSSLHE